jgi:hypothetical protein
MNRVLGISLSALLVAAPLCAQNPPKIVYAESFRQGSTQITEESFETKLSPQDPTYRERLKDSRGQDRYVFTIMPQGPQGDTKITSWRVSLADLHHPIYSNVLVADLQGTADAKDNLWWFNPDQFAPVPIRAQRIMKVDSFYVVMQVKDYHFTPLDSPYLDSMVVDFRFCNSDPRSAAK